jgi:hypothetical protein
MSEKLSMVIFQFSFVILGPNRMIGDLKRFAKAKWQMRIDHWKMINFFILHSFGKSWFKRFDGESRIWIAEMLISSGSNRNGCLKCGYEFGQVRGRCFRLGMSAKPGPDSMFIAQELPGVAGRDREKKLLNHELRLRAEAWETENHSF